MPETCFICEAEGADRIVSGVEEYRAHDRCVVDSLVGLKVSPTELGHMIKAREQELGRSFVVGLDPMSQRLHDYHARAAAEARR